MSTRREVRKDIYTEAEEVWREIKLKFNVIGTMQMLLSKKIKN